MARFEVSMKFLRFKFGFGSFASSACQVLRTCVGHLTNLLYFRSLKMLRSFCTNGIW